LRFRAGAARLKVDGFVDVIGEHANCAAHNKYGIAGLTKRRSFPSWSGSCDVRS